MNLLQIWNRHARPSHTLSLRLRNDSGVENRSRAHHRQREAVRLQRPVDLPQQVPNFQIDTVIDIVENMLQSVFVLGKKAKALKGVIPQRPKIASVKVSKTPPPKKPSSAPATGKP